MSKGFLVLAQNSEGIDYVRQAYALALSIKATQSEHASISLITNDPVPEHYSKIFDNIIPIPWKDHAADSAWKVENRWKFIHITPYDETIVLDSDMLLLDDMSKKWELLSKQDLFFVSDVTDYRGKVVSNESNRQVFTSNSLPNVYFGLHYFKKTPTAYEFYKTLEFIVNNWETAYSKITPKAKQRWVSMDVSAAIALKITGLDDIAICPSFNMTFTHMKANIQGWPTVIADWVNSADHYFNDNFEIFINQYKQKGVLHYVEDKFLTDDLISLLEKINE